MGGQIERHGQPLLAGSDVAPVKSIALLGGGKPGILPDRPWLGDVHGAVRAPHEGRQPWHAIQVLATFQILRRVEGRQIDLFKRLISPFFERLAGFLFELDTPGVEAARRLRREGHLSEIRKCLHTSIPRR
jgi:hypothetical protein